MGERSTPVTLALGYSSAISLWKKLLDRVYRWYHDVQLHIHGPNSSACAYIKDILGISDAQYSLCAFVMGTSQKKIIIIIPEDSRPGPSATFHQGLYGTCGGLDPVACSLCNRWDPRGNSQHVNQMEPPIDGPITTYPVGAIIKGMVATAEFITMVGN